ncbi:MAG: hypothetical protein P9L88_04605 [Candidatus Tantalella remota]|nr:hypothetical protein [Candidatus Tantalella remota]
MKRIISLVLLACFLAPHLAFAGAWTVPQKQMWSQYTVKWNWAKSQFDNHGKKDRYPSDSRSWGWSMGPEMHVGITDWLNVFWLMEYKEGWWKEYARPTLPGWGPGSSKNHGITNIDIGTKIRFMEAPVVLSGQVKYSIWNPDYEDHALEDRAEQPGLSDRSNGLELRLLMGKYFGTKIPFYWGGETGYRWNNHALCNQIPFFTEIGFWPTKWLLIKSEIDGYWTHDNTGDVRKSYAIWRIGPVIQLMTIYHLWRGVNVTAKEFTSDVTRASKSLNLEVQYGNTFWGENTAAAQECVLKVSTQF